MIRRIIMAFKKDFLWCVSGAAAQQDGGYFDGGKGLNIWEAVSDGLAMSRAITIIGGRTISSY